MKPLNLMALLGACFFVSFSVKAQPTNNDFSGSLNITSLINTCSGDAAYTTVAATADLAAGSCWNTGGGGAVSNVWFHFSAPASGSINIIVDVGGAKGTQGRTQLAIWEADGSTQVACNRYVNDSDDVTVNAVGLTPGVTYYVSVDVQSTGFRGTFSLCLDDAVDYDLYEGSIDVTSLINSCSSDAAYTTIGATGDKNDATCWNTSGSVPLFNRWFKFTAPALGLIDVTVDIGGSKGTQRRTQLAIWENDGTTQVACNRYVNDADDVTIGATGLTPGATYYISVDAQNSGYRGSFSLCLSDAVDYNFYEGAIDVTTLINSCSSDAAYTTIGATGDKNDAACWNTTGSVPLFNRWFKFTAPALGLIDVTVDIGGSKGTQRRTQLAIWENDGTTQVACNRYINDADDVSIGVTNLTPGATYYISVDAQNSGYYGSFSLCLSDAVDYNFYEGAIDVTTLINSCSSDAAYTTIGATGDKNDAACWNTTGSVPLFNRWFKFTAPALGLIDVTVDIGGSKGTQRRTQLAIWENDGTTQVACNRYVNDADDVTIGATGLTPGATYYISVDAQNSGYYGSFSLCLSDAVDYNFYEGAVDVTSLINSCSSDAAYTTIGATGDKNDASCWNTTGSVPLFNRWFKFTAPALGLIDVTVDIGGSKGTQRRTQLAIWENDGTTQVACNRYVNDADDVTIGATGLTPGATYYISVDAQNSGYYGSFSLCLSDAVDYNFYEGAVDVTSLINSCSADAVYTTIGATGDKNDASCWNTAGSVTLFNRWFKFTAPALGLIDVTVDIGGSKGTQRRTQLAIWENDGITQVACNRYVNDADDVTIGATGLTPGAIYYISVDAQNSGYYGSFSLCLSDAVDYNFFEGATLISDIHNFCSSDALYTTIGATSDKNDASCWNTAGGVALYNRWFQFVAGANGYINVTVDVGGSKGTQRRTQLAIWQSDGVTQVACNRYTNDADDVSIGAVGLTPGATYYISVDVQNSGYYGSFTLCVTDEQGYDYYEGAIEITDLNSYCSSDAAYTTIGATRDKNRGSCWNTAGAVPLYNRWFKFTAVSPIVTITVDIGGTKGTQRRTQLALWQSDGTTQVACARYAADADDVTISTGGLTVGSVYYISVDVQNSGYFGSFTLCVNNIDGNFYSLADGAWADGNNWSTGGFGGPVASDYPKAGDVAHIQGHTMTITSAEVAAAVNLIAATNTTGLTISNASLSVAGKFTITNPGNNFNVALTFANSSLTVNDDFTINRNGGTAIVSLIASGTTMTVNRDLNVYSTAGTGDNTLTFGGASILTVNDELRLSNTGGPKTTLTVNSSSGSIRNNLYLLASADNLVELNLFAGSQLYLGNSIVRNISNYGILTSTGNSTIHLNSSTNLQTLAGNAGSGTGDAITYENVTINNSRLTTPQITLGGSVTIPGTLTLTDGLIRTTSSNILNLLNSSTVSLGSNASYVDGPMTYEVATSTPDTQRNFPIGKNNYYRPMELFITQSDNSSAIYTAEHFSTSAATLGYTLPPTVERVSGSRYWRVTRSGASNLTSANAQLYYDVSDEVTDFINLTVVKNIGVGTDWVDVGGTATGNGSGSILSGPFTSFSDLTIANLHGGSNPLPITLTSFTALNKQRTIELNWTTASELGNDYFAIERSVDGLEFIELATVKGQGTTQVESRYTWIDNDPLSFKCYYRLKQVDFSGTFTYSNIIAVRMHYEEKQAIWVVPNPSTAPEATIFLSGLGKNNAYKVEFYSMTGHIQYTLEIKTNEQGESNAIIRHNLAPGLYMIHVVGNTQLATRYLVK